MADQMYSIQMKEILKAVFFLVVLHSTATRNFEEVSSLSEQVNG